MPIYAPSLPPRPDLGQGSHPILVMFRFDLRRVLRLKLGRFFGFVFAILLLVLCVQLYANHLMASKASLAQVKSAMDQFLPQGAEFQARLLNDLMIAVLWLQVALVGGGLVARDTLYRIRPLLYAHPVTPRDYLLAKFAFAGGLPLAVMLAFTLLPWGLSMAIAGLHGPVWATAPLRLVPAALAIAALMGSVTLGASSLAASPKAGFGWALGILMGSGALGGVLAGTLGDQRWMALGVTALGKSWPRLAMGLDSDPGWVPVLLGTALHVGIWTFIAVRRTRPSEATL
jgi:ABC-type transport system involved in multi-copper enzyme maturation permease subunit